MKRFVSTLLAGACLAAIAVSAARAEQFTITRLIAPTSIASTTGGNGFIVNFLNSGVESPQANSDPPGTSATLLNYTVTTVGAPSGTYNFNDTFTLSVLWTGYGPNASGDTYTSIFDGKVTGTAAQTLNGPQDNVVVTLTPQAGAMSFNLGPVPFTLYDLQATLPPLINDVSNPGAVSAQVVSSVIPEPGSMALLGTALLPVLGLARRRRK